MSVSTDSVPDEIPSTLHGEDSDDDSPASGDPSGDHSMDLDEYAFTRWISSYVHHTVPYNERSVAVDMLLV